MKPPRIDAPIKLGRGFSIVYVFALATSLWLLHPWSGGDTYFAVLGVLLFPFLGSIFLYSISLFAWAIASDFRGQKQAFFVFGLAVVGIFVAYAIVSWRDRPISSFATGTVAISATALLRYLSMRPPNLHLSTTDPAKSGGGEASGKR